MRSLAVIVLALVVILAPPTALAEPDPEPNPFAAGWDKPINPDKDCTFKREKGGLTITLPGRHHDLNVGSGKMNAPRLLRDVEGDFIAEVRVGGKFATSATPSAGRDGPEVSAGLVVMASWGVESVSGRKRRISAWSGRGTGCSPPSVRTARDGTISSRWT